LTIAIAVAMTPATSGDVRRHDQRVVGAREMPELQ
jgi:hypothetical protein